MAPMSVRMRAGNKRRRCGNFVAVHGYGDFCVWFILHDDTREFQLDIMLELPLNE